MSSPLDVLIPTFERPAALAVTLTGLLAQTERAFRIVISDQGADRRAADNPAVAAVLRVHRLHGREVELHAHRPPRGLAEQRQFLLDQARAPYALFLDDDVLLEADVVARMLRAIRSAGCGFVGCAPIGLSYRDDVRPHEQAIEFWERGVAPERVVPGGAEWARHRLHNAANPLHVQERLAVPPGKDRLYRVAWVGACVLYDVAVLRAVGGFRFWRDLPAQHAGEDVLAQLRVMRLAGGCGLLPSGAYHLELPTTVGDRVVDAPRVLDV